MKHISLFIAFLSLSTLYAKTDSESAPRDGSVTGTVIDANLNQALPYVNIIIKNEAGETITGGITDDQGYFEIKHIPEGKNVITIQYMGYKTVSKPLVIGNGKHKIDLGNILLEEDIASLDEVTVVAEVSSVQQKVDRKVITIGKDLTTTGASASEIMNNLPSVTVDSQSGDISLRGNENVRVLLDGKPTNVPAAQLLKQIPSTSIKSVELITNPSAKYNPEGMSGIINIILHKNANVGFNGNLNVGFAKEISPNFNSSIDMNYRNGKLNFYGNYGNNIGKSTGGGKIDRFDDNTEQIFKNWNNNKSHLYKLGIDYYINDNNVFSVYTNQNLYDGKRSNSTDIIYLLNDNPNFRQYLDNENENTTSSYNAAFKHDFKKEGHNISLEADYSTFDSDEIADFSFTDNSSYRDLVNNKRDNTLINLDYVNPLSETSKLEIGAEYRANNADNFYNTTNTNLYDSDYEYNRSIYSFYTTYGQTFDKWSYQVGARIEQYEVEAIFDQVTQETSTFNDEKFSIYPSAFLTYNTSEKTSLQLSYSRRVDRPGLGQINPIREWSSPRVTSIGNPELRQQFTNSLELNLTKNVKGGNITAGTFYRIINDEINRSVFMDPEDPAGDRVILTYDNFDRNNAFGFEASSNYRPTKWWNFNASAEYYFKTVRGVVEQENLEIKNSTFNLRMNNNFKATKSLSFSLFGMYRGQDENLQHKRKPMVMVNTGLRYSFLEDDRATFSFSYNDIFNTMKFAFERDRPFPSEGEFNWESNQWRIGLTYRFGGGKYKALNRKQRDNNETQGSGGFM
ncbi:outer membrane beta-barrel family protein [Mangrovimonas sp. DI 80]|uniref:outer membrane beta-barrel family protein n=1 Tax=Mangrovimonas sp. DI 80 TaxID=1779330 RepID=UPI000978AA8F|nr:outer membrane beta-barrel family protein [Mangrovimonas sp. DI 80]OMP31099.1 TonB-dependent receptor [Mangrovimonas sp. DI 80]